MPLRPTPLFLLTATLMVLLVAPVQADPKSEAKRHLANASEAHKQGRYADARTELNIAYSLDPQPSLLYAIGQVYVMEGKCDLAITFYQRFLDAKPTPAQAAKATEAIETCKKLQPVANPPVPEPTPVPTPPAASPNPAPAPTPAIQSTRSPWYRDVLGDVLVGTGVTAGVVGLVLLRGAHADRDAADHATGYQAYNDLVEQAHTKQTYGIVLAAGGGALIAAGVIRYVTRSSTTEVRGVALVPTASGGLVTWGARF